MPTPPAHAPLPTHWWRPIWILNALCIAGTFLSVGLWPKNIPLRLFHLGIETNLATWWEAAQILLFALLAQSSALAVRDRDRRASRAFTGLAVVGLALFADEIGSLHERMGMLAVVPKSFRDLPAAMLVAGCLGASLWILEKKRALVGNVARLVSLAFGILALAYGQELVERKLAFDEGSRSLRTVFEEGTELVGVFLLLLAAVRSRRHLSRAPLGSTEDWGSVKWMVTVGAVLAVPVLFLRSRLTFEELRLPRLGDFGIAIPMWLFICGAVAAALNAWRQRPPVRAWWQLALVLIVLSISAEVHLHRLLLSFVSWRYDIDLLVGLPLLAFALLSIPELRRPGVIGGLAVLAISVLVSVFVLEQPALPLINLTAAALGSGVALLQTQPAAARLEASARDYLRTVNRRTTVASGVTTRTR